MSIDTAGYGGGGSASGKVYGFVSTGVWYYMTGSVLGELHQWPHFSSGWRMTRSCGPENIHLSLIVSQQQSAPEKRIRMCIMKF